MQHSGRTEIPPPPGWGDDKLSDFLGNVRLNQFGTFYRKKKEYYRLQEIDNCYSTAVENLSEPKTLLPALLLFRAHSAFRAGSATSMAGQGAETFVLLRSCLEYSGYALLIAKSPELGAIWLRRHRSSQALAQIRDKFGTGNVEKCIAAVDQVLGRVYRKLYQTTIDFGAHPNERGLTTNMAADTTHSQHVLLSIYLHEDGPELDHMLKLTAQTGLCSLHIFQNIFSERFLLLGLRERILELRNGL